MRKEEGDERGKEKLMLKYVFNKKNITSIHMIFFSLIFFINFDSSKFIYIKKNSITINNVICT